MAHGPGSGHPADCFGCRVKTVSFSASAMPTRRPHEAWSAKTEKRWAEDHAAYRRLHDDGITPAHIDGAARVEQEANTAEEATLMDRRPAWSEP